MTIKYSPELKKNDDPDPLWSPNGRCPVWVCDSGVQLNWEVGNARTCWVGLSDKPVRGAMRITNRGHDRPPLARHATWSEPFCETPDLCDFLKQFGDFSDVWLWIEVPA